MASCHGMGGAMWPMSMPMTMLVRLWIMPMEIWESSNFSDEFVLYQGSALNPYLFPRIDGRFDGEGEKRC